jgi:hypothetical protein
MSRPMKNSVGNKVMRKTKATTLSSIASQNGREEFMRV